MMPRCVNGSPILSPLPPKRRQHRLGASALLNRESKQTINIALVSTTVTTPINMISNPSETLSSLQSLQSTPLTIIRLSEPLSSQTSTRTSDISVGENPSPASLAADLTHYRELFSKLRFSYLEQVTKEKFLRAIVGDPPLVVEHGENIELEAQLAEVKEVLKAQKEDVAKMVEELEGRGREMARRE